MSIAFKWILIMLVAFPLASAGQDLAREFADPPMTSRPRTWMHAMSGNMSKVGMSKDLEAIAAAGQGGVLLFNIANMIPYGDVPYGSDEHHNIIAHAAKECERLGLSFGVHNCDGWTSSGGPSIQPEESMKMVVHSEQVVDGGGRVNVQLAQPTTREAYYRDIAVVAYPALASEVVDAGADPVVTASHEGLDLSVIRNGQVGNKSHLPFAGLENTWVNFDFGKPHAVRSLFVGFIGEDKGGTLSTSNDGVNFTYVRDLPRPTRAGKKQRYFADEFEPITARYFRINFDKEIDIREVDLRATPRFPGYLQYSGLSQAGNFERLASQRPAPGNVILKSSIIDLTDQTGADGTLRAKLPPGKWMVMRFGQTSTGALNWPASKWGIGLECDKFSRPAFKKHFDAFSQRVIDRAKRDAPNALQYIEIDSYEMGGQNWTDGFADIFRERYGYDLISLLPVFAGRYVDGPETVAGFTYDLNQLYVDLMTENYFKYFTELCNENGLKSYTEPYGNGPVSTLDIVEHTDLPMTEFWINRPNQKRLTGTITGAHIYGKPIISAEAFTARPLTNWKVHPAMAKPSGDMAWVAGVNEMMFHRFVHQANTQVEPGLTMGFWGSHFDRTQTWWMNAGKAWFDYLARGGHLLRQGHHAADVLVFVGDDPHTDGIKRSQLRYPLPNGINYDVTNARALRDRFIIEGSTLTLPEGNAYSYLALDDTEIMKLATLRRVLEIAEAGVPVIGERPKRLAGYNRTPAQQEEFNFLSDVIWSLPNVVTSFDFTELPADFRVDGLDKAFMHRRTDETDIYFFYNEADTAARYSAVFRVANKVPELWDARTGKITRLANFRSEGQYTRVWLNLAPEESAFIVFRSPAAGINSVVTANTANDYTLTKDNHVLVSTDKAEASAITWNDGTTTWIPAATFPATMELSTDWDVAFRATDNYAATVKFATLTDWRDHPDENIKYYSGTADYTKTFTLPAPPAGDLRYHLDLGQVSVIAEVLINGQRVDLLWMPPFKVDITDYLKGGKNELEVRLTNQWTNRLIGDEQYPRNDGFNNSKYNPRDDSKMPDWYVRNEAPPASPRVTFETGEFYKKGDPLLPSGLIGPVQITYSRTLKVQPGE